MINFKLSHLAIFGNYKLIGFDQDISALSTDSRACQGALFVALIGQRFDGHDYIVKAIENGAKAILCSKPFDFEKYPNISVVLCEDTQKALGECAYLVRRQCKGKIASLTGSCGKTTVKEFTHSILSLNGKSMCTNGNFNNDIGVPLTLLRLESDTDFAVIEQGASHLFDIAHTCRFVKADTALINNVGGAHIEGFGSYDGVYKGKSEILEDVLSNGGMAVVPSDSQYFTRWQSDYKSAFLQGKLFSFGSHDFDLVQYSEVQSSLNGIRFKLKTPNDKFNLSMNLIGAHNASNAAAAAALALITGAKEESIKLGLEKASSMQGRLFVHQFKNMNLIDDAYNASFNAVLAAIDTLSLYEGHRVLVFGDMGELGEAAIELHQKVGKYADGKIDEILALGDLTKATCQSCANKSSHFNCKSDLVQYAVKLLEKYPKVTFLVKGSHFMHMDEISKELITLGV